MTYYIIQATTGEGFAVIADSENEAMEILAETYGESMVATRYDEAFVRDIVTVEEDYDGYPEEIENDSTILEVLS